ncbi:MAG: TRAP transporter small permease [Proteobacteria bacterium]|nr:TRAP transporter small permease [Pseudomonadota bacterium]
MLIFFNSKLNKIENFLIVFSGIAIFIVMILTSFQIISRVLGYPWPGYLELSELSVSIFAFLGVAYAQRVDSHIRMELIVGNLKGRLKWFVEVFATFFGFLIILILIKYSFLFALDSYKIGDTTYDYLYPTWPAKALVPIGFSIWALRLLLELIGYVRMLFLPNSEPFAIPVTKSPEELANEEIKVIRE